MWSFVVVQLSLFNCHCFCCSILVVWLLSPLGTIIKLLFPSFSLYLLLFSCCCRCLVVVAKKPVAWRGGNGVKSGVPTGRIGAVSRSIISLARFRRPVGRRIWPE